MVVCAISCMGAHKWRATVQINQANTRRACGETAPSPTMEAMNGIGGMEQPQTTLNTRNGKLVFSGIRLAIDSATNPEKLPVFYQTSTGPLGTGIADRCAAAGSCMKDATIGAGR